MCVLRSWDWSVDFALLPSIELGHRTATTVLRHRIVICAGGRADLNRVGCYLPIRVTTVSRSRVGASRIRITHLDAGAVSVSVAPDCRVCAFLCLAVFVCVCPCCFAMLRL